MRNRYKLKTLRNVASGMNTAYKEDALTQEDHTIEGSTRSHSTKDPKRDVPGTARHSKGKGKQIGSSSESSEDEDDVEERAIGGGSPSLFDINKDEGPSFAKRDRQYKPSLQFLEFLTLVEKWTVEGGNARERMVSAISILRALFPYGEGSIIVIGAQTSGKSTIVMEITGQVITVTAATIGTKVATHIVCTHDPKAVDIRASVSYRGQEHRDLSLTELYQWMLDTFSGDGSIDTKNTLDLLLCLPYANFGMSVLDEPGMNNKDSESLECTEMALEQSHPEHSLVLLTHSAAHEDVDTALWARKQLRKKLKRIPPGKLIVVVTKGDRLNMDTLPRTMVEKAVNKTGTELNITPLDPLDFVANSIRALLPKCHRNAKVVFTASSSLSSEDLLGISGAKERFAAFMRSSEANREAMLNILQDSHLWRQHNPIQMGDLSSLSEEDMERFLEYTSMDRFLRHLFAHQLAEAKKLVTKALNFAEEKIPAIVKKIQNETTLLEEMPDGVHLLFNFLTEVFEKAHYITLVGMEDLPEGLGVDLGEELQLLQLFSGGEFPSFPLDQSHQSGSTSSRITHSSTAKLATLAPLLERLKADFAYASELYDPKVPAFDRLERFAAGMVDAAGGLAAAGAVYARARGEFSRRLKDNREVRHRLAIAHTVNVSTALALVLAKSETFHPLFSEGSARDHMVAAVQQLSCIVSQDMREHIATAKEAGRQADALEYGLVDIHTYLSKDHLGLLEDQLPFNCTFPRQPTLKDSILSVLVAFYHDKPFGQLDNITSFVKAVTSSTEFPGMLANAPAFIHNDLTFVREYTAHIPDSVVSVALSSGKKSTSSSETAVGGESNKGKSISSSLRSPFIRAQLAKAYDQRDKPTQEDRAQLSALLVAAATTPDTFIESPINGETPLITRNSAEYIYQRKVSSGLYFNKLSMVPQLGHSRLEWTLPDAHARKYVELLECTASVLSGMPYPYIEKDIPCELRKLSVRSGVEFLARYFAFVDPEYIAHVRITKAEALLFSNNIVRYVLSLPRSERMAQFRKLYDALHPLNAVAFYRECIIALCRYHFAKEDPKANMRANLEQLQEWLCKWKEIVASLRSFRDFLTAHGEQLAGLGPLERGIAALRPSASRPNEPSQDVFPV